MTQSEWNAYTERTLKALRPLLSQLGYTLDELQPHLGGERYLMQALTTTSGAKLILLGKSVDNTRVVIKAADDAAGRKELRHDRECRRVLHEIHFAYNVFFSPRELLYTEKNGFTISIQEFIAQERQFLERPVTEQFSLTLKAFKAQEGAHATTYEHYRLVGNTFGSIDAKGYMRAMRQFVTRITTSLPNDRDLHTLLEAAAKKISENRERIEQYCGFLTHVDFVPHNIRVKDGEIYLLDNSSLRFGNKYEGWARFLNFMTLYNRALEAALIKYVKDNRAEEESESLHLMRMYRLAEIISYYAQSLDKTSGDHRTLNTKRIEFWGKVLAALLNDASVDETVIDEYRRVRDTLRSPEEKQRQIGLH